EALGVLRVVVADPGALVDLGPSLRDGLAHLGGHEAGQLVASLAEERARASSRSRPLGESREAPVEEGPVGVAQGGGHRLGGGRQGRGGGLRVPLGGAGGGWGRGGGGTCGPRQSYAAREAGLTQVLSSRRFAVSPGGSGQGQISRPISGHARVHAERLTPPQK